MYRVSVAPVALAVCGSNTTVYVAVDRSGVVSRNPFSPRIVWIIVPNASYRLTLAEPPVMSVTLRLTRSPSVPSNASNAIRSAVGTDTGVGPRPSIAVESTSPAAYGTGATHR